MANMVGIFSVHLYPDILLTAGVLRFRFPREIKYTDDVSIQKNSLLLSLIMLIFGIFQIGLLRFFQFPKFGGRTIHLSRRQLAWIVILSVVASWTIGSLILFSPWRGARSVFYGALYVVLWFVTVFSLLAIQRISRRVAAAGFITAIISVTTLFFKRPTADGLFMIGGLFWIGAILITRWRIPLRYFLWGFGAVSLFDAANIFLVHPDGSGILLDEPIRFNGLIEVGQASLGVGDFALAAIALSLIQRERGNSWAFIFALWFAGARLLLRVISPLGTIALPYLPIMLVPVIVLLMVKPRGKNVA